MKHALILLLLLPLCSPAFADTTNASATPLAHPLAATISPSDARLPCDAPAEHFTGKATATPLFSPEAPARASAAYVRFAPGARTDWHTHPLGQQLVVTEGHGLLQFWGGPIQPMARGDVVSIPPGQKHWHGASASEAMTHLAVQEQVDGKSVTWLEKVSDAQYSQSSQTPSSRENTATPQPSRAQQLMGDFAPKLAELTDQVLYADIWERPGLSKRDRSLATVSALMALNRPDQLRSHLALAIQNGMTREELAEVITHLAFYSGWPSAVSAIAVVKEALPAQ